jgi:hypothetical protein
MEKGEVPPEEGVGGRRAEVRMAEMEVSIRVGAFFRLTPLGWADSSVDSDESLKDGDLCMGPPSSLDSSMSESFDCDAGLPLSTKLKYRLPILSCSMSCSKSSSSREAGESTKLASADADSELFDVDAGRGSSTSGFTMVGEAWEKKRSRCESDDADRVLGGGTSNGEEDDPEGSEIEGCIGAECAASKVGLLGGRLPAKVAKLLFEIDGLIASRAEATDKLFLCPCCCSCCAEVLVEVGRGGRAGDMVATDEVAGLGGIGLSGLVSPFGPCEEVGGTLGCNDSGFGRFREPKENHRCLAVMG